MDGLSKAMNLRRIKSKPAMERWARKAAHERRIRELCRDGHYGQALTEATNGRQFEYVTEQRKAADALSLDPPYGGFGSPGWRTWQIEENTRQYRLLEALASVKAASESAQAKPRRPWWRFWR